MHPPPGKFLEKRWQAGDAEVEAEDLDEALADARALRTIQNLWAVENRSSTCRARGKLT